MSRPGDNLTEPVSVSVLHALTLDEKISLLEGVESWTTGSVERLGITPLYLTDGPHGVRKVRRNSGAFGLTDIEPASSFPTAASIANSWDPENAWLAGAAIGRESVALGVDVLLAPGVNIKRNPLCGRNFEYYSEDPLVSGVFGAAFVEGVQSQGIAASVKHLAANSNENYRFSGDSFVDDRALREIYLRAFERIVKDARPATVMCAYNAINGTYCSDNRDLLTSVLRDEWGFDGLVMTDWGATHDRVSGVLAGCDLDMPGEVSHNRRVLKEAVLNGTLPESVLDASVERVLALMERCADSGRQPTPVGPSADPTVLATQLAADGAVLLTNDGVLPLDPEAGRIAVIGEIFESMRFQGAGSSLVNPPAVVSPQAAFDARGITYRYARGYRALSHDRDSDLEREALAIATDADTVLFFGGLTDLEECEGFDRTTMALGESQTALLEALLDAGSRVVLVLFAGAPVELRMVDRLAAVLDMYLPGMQGGEATAALLFGEQSPSGKLTETWTRTAEQASSAAEYDSGRNALYYESVYVGYRFHDKAGTDLAFPFGHGLTYTEFTYTDVRTTTSDGTVAVEVDIANTGDFDAAEIVQIYVRNAPSAVFKADKELRAFAKLMVPAGGRATARCSFNLDDLAHWDIAKPGWVLDNGTYEVVAAASATDERLTTPLVVTSGIDGAASPYSLAVDAAYATPPTEVPAAFDELVGRPVVVDVPDGRLGLESRLADSRKSLLGRVFYAAVVGSMKRDFDRALAMEPSLQRDALVKNSHFVYRMMPSETLRAMAMASGGAFPFRVAVMLAELDHGHPIRAVRALITGGAQKHGAQE